MANKILVIDDEDIILQSLKVIFQRAGIETDTESNPVSAIKRYGDVMYNVVLVDVLMPQMRGVEVIRAIKEINPLCNVIVMTAFSNMVHVIDCIEAGAQDYLTKPFTDMKLLIDIVRHTLDRVERWKKSFGLELHRAAQVRKTGGGWKAD